MLRSLTFKNRAGVVVATTKGTAAQSIAVRSVDREIQFKTSGDTTVLNFLPGSARASLYKGIYNDLIAQIQADGKLPYITSINKAKASEDGLVLLLGGLSTQSLVWGDQTVLTDDLTAEVPLSPIDATEDNRILITDTAAAPLDYPDLLPVYQAIATLNMWMDGMLDNTVTDEAEALERYQERYSSWDANFGPLPDSQTERPAGMLTATKLFYQYIGLVHWWNYLVTRNSTYLSIMPHPADPAGVVIGYSGHLTDCATTDTPFTLEVTGPDQDGLTVWPRVNKLTLDSKPLTPPVVTSDDGKFPAKAEMTVPKTSSVKHVPSVLMVAEALPYLRRADSPYAPGTEKDYYNSRKNNRIVATGGNDWNVVVTLGDEKAKARISTPYALGV